MKLFSLIGEAEILHINIRKEGPEGEVTALDVKLKAETDGAILQSIIGCESESDLLMAFWDVNDEDGNPRFWGMTTAKAETFFEGQHDVVMFGSHTVRPRKIAKFEFECRPRMQVELTFVLSIGNPDDNLLALLAEQLKGSVLIEITPDADLLDGMDLAA